MLLLFSITLPSQEFIQALTWTFIHSLWQGILLCIVAVGIVFFTKKKSALLRYNLLTAVLLLFLFTIVVRFNNQFSKAKQVAQVAQIILEKEVIAGRSEVVFTDKMQQVTLSTKAVSFVTSNAYWVILIWFSIIVFRFIRLTVGLYELQRIKKINVFSAGEYWNNRIKELCRQLNINKHVQLLQSAITRMPVAIGFLKPVVLFPAAMLASLPANEVEAILLHELAHIRRKDFLVNLLQSIVEIIFFFNPAVLWVSALIKIERENCCDDIAITITDSKQNYIKALLSFQEYNLPAEASLATAFAGEKKYLLDRVKRIIYNHNKTLNNMEKKFLAVGIIITSVCIFTFSSSNAQKKQKVEQRVDKTISKPLVSPENGKAIEPMSITEEVSGNVSDTDSVFTGKINTERKGKKYMVEIKDGQVYELYVDGKKIANERMADHKDITDQIMLQAKIDMKQSRKDMAQSKIDMEQSRKDLEQSKINLEQSRKDMAQSKIDMEQSNKDMAKSKIDMAQSNKDMEQSEKDMAQSKMDMAQSDKDMEQSKKDMEQSKIDMAQLKKDMKQSKKDMEQSKIDMEQSKKDMEQSRKDMEQSKKYMEQSRKDMEQSKRDMAQSRIAMEQSRILQEKIIEDFISEHIISNKNELSSYKLDSKELIVNGIKQSDVIHKRIKEKYGKVDKSISFFNKSNVNID